MMMMMGRYRCLYVMGSLTLTLALIATGISFFCPYWLINVTKPPPGNTIEDDASRYIYNKSTPTNAVDYIYRGLWAQCSTQCNWFFEHDFFLQRAKFNTLNWHLATQIVYITGFFLVFFCELMSRVQLCCEPKKCVFRTLGFVLLSSFVIQSAAIAVFGGFANKAYGATAHEQDNTYFGWGFWMAIAGGGLTLFSGIFFLILDCCTYEFDEEDFK